MKVIQTGLWGDDVTLKEKSDTHPTALDILLEMYETVRRVTGRSGREGFNIIVAFLADATRVHPLPQEYHRVGEKLLPFAVPFARAIREEKRSGKWTDPLGILFEREGCGINDMGQFLTPPSVIKFMVKLMVSKNLMRANGRASPVTILDPAAGTGRFLIEAAFQAKFRDVILFGVEIDLDLYRACLVNMRLYTLGVPSFILWANSLLVDLAPGHPNWRYANLWDPLDWRKNLLVQEEE
jgi:hypothetical protein